jgi:hypothetical protein
MDCFSLMHRWGCVLKEFIQPSLSSKFEDWKLIKPQCQQMKPAIFSEEEIKYSKAYYKNACMIRNYKQRVIFLIQPNE